MQEWINLSSAVHGDPAAKNTQRKHVLVTQRKLVTEKIIKKAHQPLFSGDAVVGSERHPSAGYLTRSHLFDATIGVIIIKYLILLRYRYNIRAYYESTIHAL
jgi:hypothetical protein